MSSIERRMDLQTGFRVTPPAAIFYANEPTADATALLEDGSVLLFPDLDFNLGLGPELFAHAGKTVSFDSVTGRLKGGALHRLDREQLSVLMDRYATWSEAVLRAVAPRYAKHLQRGKTSFRPHPVGQLLSQRRDDGSLHIDAFPSQPVQGRRVLRIFRNINPWGEPRVWEVGEPFARYAARFLPRIQPERSGLAWMLNALGFSKGRRTPYDQLMLQLDDAARQDADYQATGPRHRLAFQSGATWIAFTDAMPHAAVQGRFALEQTFFLPTEAMIEPSAAPLAILERMTGRKFA